MVSCAGLRRGGCDGWAVCADTGGICPLLWRPLVSLEALDIPAYRLDISAFAGQLQDGHAHTLEFSVVDADPAGSQGVWYIDPVLLLERRARDRSDSGDVHLIHVGVGFE